MPEYKVKQGDCISSIAEKHGFSPDKIWDHPDNANLKEKRKDQNILFHGDVVFVPDKEDKEESGATEQRHRFRKKGVPAKLHLQLLEDDEPRANESYTLIIDGNLLSGTTDADGRFEQPVPPNAKSAKLLVGEAQDEYVLNLGHIDPVDEVAGVQARLNNLGFGSGNLNGVLGPETKAALKRFQEKYELSESGKPDEATQKKLLDVHGC
jgi:Putative peptidoglycan binding domain/LysM domain